MIFERWELISEQERLSNKNNINQVCKILDKNDINTSWSPLKSWLARGNTMDPKKEDKQHSDQLGGKERLEWWINEINQSYV
jgi:hypothetical protein